MPELATPKRSPPDWECPPYASSHQTNTTPSSTNSQMSSCQNCVRCQVPKPSTASITISPPQARRHMPSSTTCHPRNSKMLNELSPRWKGWVSAERHRVHRHPRIPPQNKASDEVIGILRRSQGRPKGRTKDVIRSAKSLGDSAVEAAPQPQVSRTRGQLLLPKRHRD